MVNKIFKIGLLVLGFGYLAYLFGTSTTPTATASNIGSYIGRYKLQRVDHTFFVIDTTGANLYTSVYENEKWGEWNKTNPVSSTLGK